MGQNQYRYRGKAQYADKLNLMGRVPLVRVRVMWVICYSEVIMLSCPQAAPASTSA